MRDKLDKRRGKKCGYDLRGLEERRCPECGQVFDPGDASTYLTKPVSGTWFLTLTMVVVILVGIPLVYASLKTAGIVPNYRFPRTVFAVLFNFGFLIACHVVWNAWKGGRSPDETVHPGLMVPAGCDERTSDLR